MKTSRHIFAAMTALWLCACTSQSLETSFNNQEEDISEYAEGIQFTQVNFTITTNDQGMPSGVAREEVGVITPRITRNGGATRLSIIEGEGEPLSENGRVTLRFAGYSFESGTTSLQIARLNLGNGRLEWVVSTPYTSLNASLDSNSSVVISGSGSARGLTLFATNNSTVAALNGWSLSESDYNSITLDMRGDVLEGLRLGLVGVRTGEVCDIAFSGRYGLGKKPLGTIPANSALLYRVWVESVSN